MYHIYNLIAPGDQVRALAVRRVQTTSSTGSSDSYRVRVQLQISVTKTTFSQAAGASSGPGGGSGSGTPGGGKAAESTASLQISGQVVNENEYVRLGAFHTLDLEGGYYPCCGLYDGGQGIGSRSQWPQTPHVASPRYNRDTWGACERIKLTP